MPTAITIIDLEGLRRYVSGDAALVGELLEIFELELPRMNDALRTALAAQDPRAVAEAAHRLKGSLLTIGARCAASAERLERAAREESWPDVQRLVRPLTEETTQVAAAVQEILKRSEL